MRIKEIWIVLRTAFRDFQDDRASMLGAALAYYTLFSLAPILVVAIGVAGVVFGSDAAQREVTAQIQTLVGSQGAEAVRMLLANASRPGAGIIAIVVGTLTLIVGATGAFLQLQEALNTVWEVRRKPGGGIMGVAKTRLLSFGLVLGVGFLLLVSLVVSAALTALEAFLAGILPGAGSLWQILNFVVSLGVITLLFATILRFLPDVRIGWKDVWFGAGVTSLLFAIGKFLIGLYLGRSSAASAYGAAGSIVVLMIWIYYSAQIVLFGAEVTQVYASRHGGRIEPTEHAMRIPSTRPTPAAG